MQSHEEQIWQLAESVLAPAGMEAVLVECLRMKAGWLVRIYMDREEGGVTLGDCEQVSNLLGDLLDVHDVPPGPYTLEVSSPGLDRPLHRDKDFLKYRGEKINVRLREKIEGRRKISGELVDYLDETGGKVLVVQTAGQLVRVPREAVLKANLEYLV
jgi:ribosome maturation factor RimP